MTFPAIAYIDIAANAFPMVAALRRIGTDRGAAVFVIVLFSGSLLTELLSLYLAFHNTNNHAILNSYNLFEFLACVLYFRSVEQSGTWRTLQGIGAFVFTGFWLIAKFTFEPFRLPAEYTHTASAGILSILAIHSLVQMMGSEETVLYRETRFWISMAACFYFFTNVILYGYMNTFTQLAITQAMHLWTIHWSLSVTAKVMFALGFVWTRRT